MLKFAHLFYSVIRKVQSVQVGLNQLTALLTVTVPAPQQPAD